jgi:hypothetical protein
LHALGDSFAHRKGDNMYAAPYGHAIPGTDTDNIHTHQALYELYGTQLFSTLLNVGKSLNFKPALEAKSFKSAISSFSVSSSDEDIQIGSIRNWHTKANVPQMRLLNLYAPEKAEPDPIGWYDFFVKYHAQYKFDLSLIDRLQFLTSTWSR